MSSIDREEQQQRFTQIWQSPPGFLGWIATVNSRPLGQRYMITALLFFAVGIVLALTMRIQLAVPDNTFLGPDAYNGVFTMHGSTMLYLFAVPFIEGLAVYFIPMLIGSRDLAYPRLTNFGYWLYVFGGVVMYASVLFGAVPDAGWTAYPPLAGAQHSGIGLDFWLLGLGLIEIAGIGAALEIVVTILKLRAPGMAIQHIPILVWTYLVTGLMIIFAFTPLLIATLMLEMDRSFGTQFFSPERGGSSLLWQHLFWWFGHPEVYIIFLPATGVVSEIIPVFTRRRLAAYSLVIAAIVSTGFVSFGLWTHHMFTTGIPELPMHFFTAASYMIALASGVQIFAWIATIWGSRPGYSVPMLFILSFFFIFVNGGLTGVMVATMPFDWQVQDTNFVVAHFHHVLIGGAVLPLLAGLHYWLPKISGRRFNEFWGRISVGLIFAGFNAAFVPLYIAGLYGMRRRVYTYPEEMGVGILNLISTLGAFVLAAGFFTSLLNLIWSAWRGKRSADNPWSAATLEWSVASPPPAYGFGRPPVVRDRYPVWVETGADTAGAYASRLSSIASAFDHAPMNWRATLLTDVTNAKPQVLQHLPGPTLLPFFCAVAILFAAIALLARNYITAGVSIIVAAILCGRWAIQEPVLDKQEGCQLEEASGLPVTGSGTQAVGWWGMLGVLSILFAVLGSFLFSYFYLRLYSAQWPQQGLPLPEPGWLYLASAGALLAAAIGQIISIKARHSLKRRMLLVFQWMVLVAGLVSVALQVLILVQTPFSLTENAYASIFHTIIGFSALLIITGLVSQASILSRLIRKKEPSESPRLVLWFQNNELLWFFSVTAGIIGLAVVYFVPHYL